MRPLAELEAAANVGLEALDALLLPAEAALTDWPSTRLTAEQAGRIAHGQALAADPSLPPGDVKVYGPSGQLIAIGVVTADGHLAPSRVFIR
jgi:tRNA pseudouridine55 synthase